MDRRLFITSGLSGMSIGAALPLVATAAADPKPPKPRNREEATKIIAEARRIVTPNGVERLETVKIGAIDQWVSVRGRDRRNPVLLHIHGGPGYVDLPTSWWFARGWEEYFTVVFWDQRAAGKTHRLNAVAAVRPTLTIERMVSDAEEMTAWIRKNLHKDKIFVLGHSWGSHPGLRIAHRHPALSDRVGLPQ